MNALQGVLFVCMALEVNLEEPSAFSQPMNTLQGVSCERMESITLDTLQGVLMAF